MEDFLKLAKNLGVRGFESHADVDKENDASADARSKKHASEKSGSEITSVLDSSILRDIKNDFG